MVEYVQSACNWIASWPWLAIGDGVKSFALPVAAPLAAFYVANKFGHIQADIGRRQAETAAMAMNTARNKLRLDLFDKRFAVYEAAALTINAALENKVTYDQRFDYMEAIKPARWLFDADVVEHLDLIFTKVFDLIELNDNINEEPDAKFRADMVARRKRCLIDIREQLATLHSLLSPYLRFTEDVKT